MKKRYRIEADLAVQALIIVQAETALEALEYAKSESSMYDWEIQGVEIENVDNLEIKDKGKWTQIDLPAEYD